MTPTVAEHWKTFSKPFANNTEFARVYMPKRKAPHAGELFKLPDHVRNLKLIAESEGEAFYHGELAEKIVACAKDNNALLALDDLAEHQADFVEPIKFTYRGYDVFEMPPNSQGLIALIALGILQQFDIRSYAEFSTECIHLQIEAMKLAFDAAFSVISDPDFINLELQDFLCPAYLQKKAALIDLKHARCPEGSVPNEQGTVYLSTADSDGMMVSFIQSHFMLFGSGVVIPNTGILMQNRGAGFSLKKGHPNILEGNKRTFHTIIPGFVMQNEKPLMSFGIMGGHMQTQAHVQFMLKHCDFDHDIKATLEAPRWYISPQNTISIEEGVSTDVLQRLADMGHRLVSNPKIIYGGGQAIFRLQDGAYVAASDPRKDGLAAGF